MAKTVIYKTVKKSFELREEEYAAEIENLFDDEDPDMPEADDEEVNRARRAEYNKRLNKSAFKYADDNGVSFDEDDVCEEIKGSLPVAKAGLDWPTDVDRKKCPRINYDEYVVYYEELKNAIEELGRYDKKLDELVLKIYAGIMRPIVKNCYYESGYSKLCTNGLFDAYQDGYIKLASVIEKGAYFLNVSENFVQSPKGFLGWTKKVIWRQFRSQVERKGLGALEEKTTSIFEPVSTKTGETVELQIEDKNNPSPLDRLVKVEMQSVFFNFIALRRYGMNRKLAAFMIFASCYNYYKESDSEARDIATKDLVHKYANISLDTLFEVFVIRFLNAPGSDLAIHSKGIKKMREQLDSFNADNERFGDTCIADYYGNGNKEPEYVISDWLSKILADYEKELDKYIKR